jgi:hypothetical protein
MTQNSYQVSHHSQGGMKFATQISPLLNLFTVTATLPNPSAKQFVDFYLAENVEIIFVCQLIILYLG